MSYKKPKRKVIRVSPKIDCKDCKYFLQRKLLMKVWNYIKRREEFKEQLADICLYKTFNKKELILILKTTRYCKIFIDKKTIPLLEYSK